MSKPPPLWLPFLLFWLALVVLILPSCERSAIDDAYGLHATSDTSPPPPPPSPRARAIEPEEDPPLHRWPPPGWKIQQNTVTERYRWIDPEGHSLRIGDTGREEKAEYDTRQDATDGAWERSEQLGHPGAWRGVNSLARE